jgi:hypothetical protein
MSFADTDIRDEVKKSEHLQEPKYEGDNHAAFTTCLMELAMGMKRLISHRRSPTKIKIRTTGSSGIPDRLSCAPAVFVVSQMGQDVEQPRKGFWNTYKRLSCVKQQSGSSSYRNPPHLEPRHEPAEDPKSEKYRKH